MTASDVFREHRRPLTKEGRPRLRESGTWGKRGTDYFSGMLDTEI